MIAKLDLCGLQKGNILILARKRLIRGTVSGALEKLAFCNFDTGSISPEQLGTLGFSILLYPRKQHPDAIVSYT